MKLLYAATTLALTLATVAAQAQNPKAAMAACAADMKSLCGTVAPGGGARMRCLNENETKLSADCKSAMAAIKSARVAVRDACKSDMTSLCASTTTEAKAGKSGKGMSCLRENQARLSKGCADALAAVPQQADGAKPADTAKPAAASPAAPAAPGAAPAAPAPTEKK